MQNSAENAKQICASPFIQVYIRQKSTGNKIGKINVNLCKFVQIYYPKSKHRIKEGHTPKERRRGAHLVFIGRWARRWINHYCLWRMAGATPDLRLPSQPKLVLMSHTHRGMARLSWPGWLVTYRDSLPTVRRSPTEYCNINYGLIENNVSC